MNLGLGQGRAELSPHRGPPLRPRATHQESEHRARRHCLAGHPRNRFSPGTIFVQILETKKNGCFPIVSPSCVRRNTLDLHLHPQEWPSQVKLHFKNKNEAKSRWSCCSARGGFPSCALQLPPATVQARPRSDGTARLHQSSGVPLQAETEATPVPVGLWGLDDQDERTVLGPPSAGPSKLCWRDRPRCPGGGSTGRPCIPGLQLCCVSSSLGRESTAQARF